MRTLNLIELQSYDDWRYAIQAGLGYVINDETEVDDMATARECTCIRRNKRC